MRISGPLKPAAENRWYVLATVYGEQDKQRGVIEGEHFLVFDAELHAKNLRIWNGWACGHLDQTTRETLAEQCKIDLNEMMPWTVKEREFVEEVFQKKGMIVPDVVDQIDFGGTKYHSIFALNNCVFGSVTFENATFNHDVELGSSSFTELARFTKTKFKDGVRFASTTFSGFAIFSEATFNNYTYFQSVNFGSAVFFSEATFEIFANFNDGVFAETARFDCVKFGGAVPKFYNCNFHQNTRFELRADHWPMVTKENARDSKEAYTRLRLAMNQLQKVDDEQFFYRQEMRCKELLEDPFHAGLIKGFRWLSDYGHSVWRPVLILFGLWLFYTSYFYGIFQDPKALFDWNWTSLATPMGLSFSNLFAIFGLRGLFYGDLLTGASGLVRFMSGLESVAGFIMLFFLGLGLRNRFRLR